MYVYVYYTYTYLKELCQQTFIYNEESECTSHTSCAQVLESPQTHFGDDWEGHIVFMIAYVLCQALSTLYDGYVEIDR